MNTTTIELPAELVAKTRAALRAVAANESAESLLADMLTQILAPNSGYFEDFITPAQVPKREGILKRLDRIRRGDRRLVKPEPLPNNLFVHRWVMERLEKMAADAERNPLGVSAEYLGGTLLDHASERAFASGDWALAVGASKKS